MWVVAFRKRLEKASRKGGNKRYMYFKKGDLARYPDGRAFIVKNATEEIAQLTQLAQIEDTNEYLYTGVNITASNKECDYINGMNFKKVEGIVLYRRMIDHKSLDETIEGVKENRIIKKAFQDAVENYSQHV